MSLLPFSSPPSFSSKSLNLRGSVTSKFPFGVITVAKPFTNGGSSMKSFFLVELVVENKANYVCFIWCKLVNSFFYGFVSRLNLFILELGHTLLDSKSSWLISFPQSIPGVDLYL